MKCWAILRMTFALAAVSSFQAALATAETVGAPSRWIGRTDPASGRFAWPGSGLELAFKGTRLEVVLDDPGDNSLVVEGAGEPRRLDLSKGRRSYLLAEGLEDRAHRVRLFRRTEGFFGATTFVEAATDGAFLPVAAPERQILVIGDSISAGYGIEGKSRDCRFSAATENQYLTYAAVAARGFGAEVTTLAVSGRGLVVNHDGTAKGTLPDLMARAIPTEAASAAAVGKEKRAEDDPSLIIVHLGTNDFGGGKRPPGFDRDYAALLERLRQTHPSAFLYAAFGPMLAAADFEAADKAIAAAVAARRQAGDTAVRYLRFAPGKGGLGCDWHPNAKAHRRMAEQLSAAIAEDLGWDAP